MIIFPMAGLSRRFTLAGYKVPKYMLEARGKSLFRHAVEGFAQYFNQIPFLFIARNINETGDFIVKECKTMGLNNYEIAILDAPTRGQGETVILGAKKVFLALDTPLTIFNIDTFRPNFCFPKEFDLDKVDGYLEVFIGSGKNWSYVRPINPNYNQVAETAEKREISQLCCTGLYHFSQFKDFQEAFDAHCQLPQEKWEAQELYVAPLYNNLIGQGSDIRYHVIASEEVIFCGTPAEYESYSK